MHFIAMGKQSMPNKSFMIFIWISTDWKLVTHVSGSKFSVNSGLWLGRLQENDYTCIELLSVRPLCKIVSKIP